MSWPVVICATAIALVSISYFFFAKNEPFPLPEQAVAPGAAPHALIRDIDLRATYELHRELLQRSPPSVLLLGDSIVSQWHRQGRDTWRRHFGRRKMLPIGVPGDRTQHILGALQAGLLDGLNDSLRLVFLNIGINNFGADGLMEEEPAFVAAGVAACVKELRMRVPRAVVVALHVFPTRLGRVKEELVTAINSRVSLPWFQISNKLLPPEVHIRSINSDLSDGLSREELIPMDNDFHLSAVGYERYARALLGMVSELAPLEAREDMDDNSYGQWADGSSSASRGLQMVAGYEEGLVHLDL